MKFYKSEAGKTGVISTKKRKLKDKCLGKKNKIGK